MSDPLLVARGARIAVDDVVTVQGLDLETRGHLLIVAGDASSLLSTLTSIPLGAFSAAVRAETEQELVPVRGRCRAVGGELRLLGRDVLAGEHAAIIGAAPYEAPVPLDVALATHLEQQARLAIAARGERVRSSEVKRQVDRALELALLTQARKRPLRTLSTGERRLASLAGALAGDPPVLVIEHPFAGLDAQGAEIVARALLAGCKARGAIVSVARLEPGTPEGAFAQRASDVAIFDRGELVSHVEPPSLLKPGRRFRVTVRTNAEALRAELEQRGAVVEGRAAQLLVQLPEGDTGSAVLVAANAVRAAVVEVIAV
ncbi:MAG: ABC transporter ATP-binding protein [Polyangiaceae bacterium]